MATPTSSQPPPDYDDFTAVITEAHRELITAEALGTDLDFAFQLQMQEAINASLAPHTSTSPYSHTNENDVEVVPSSPYDDTALATTFMIQEMEKYIQEYNDGVQCKAEFDKTRSDLERRIHDQKFASEILNIPDSEWFKYGENYHKPFECSSSSGLSSSSSAVGLECFGVYCKGLVSEEMIRGNRAMVAGIGVAVCDFRDNVIFEIKKPLIDRVLVSDIDAEFEALVQGLDAAACLDLKRVNIFVNHSGVYNYVSGIEAPSGSRIASLVGQTINLRKKFDYFRASLLEQGNIKYAYKLARDAIVSQISWPEETKNGKSMKETCVICFEDSEVAQMFSVDECLHRYCFSCMKKHVEARLLEGMAINCPHDGCRSDVKIDSCKEFLDHNMIRVVSERIKESSVPVTERVYCPRPRCSALMVKQEVLEYSKSAFVGAETCGARKCMKCQHYFCVDCAVPWHYNMSCSDYKQSNPSSESITLKSLAKQKSWRQCVKCSHMVELESGCYHITCRCGHEFCYTCGAEWKGKKPTCRCPIWDERNLLRRRR